MDRIARAVALGLTALAVGGGFVLRAAPPLPPENVELADLPAVAGTWSARDLEVDERTREELGSDALLMRAYEEPDGEAPVWLLVDYHRTQRLGSTIHSPRICYVGSGWTIEQAEVQSGTEAPETCWLQLTRNGDRLMAMYWYDSRHGRSARELTLKSHIVRSALARRSSDAVLYRLSTPIRDDDEAAARARLQRFAKTIESDLAARLPFGESTS